MRYTLNGLDCADCAARLEEELRKAGLDTATVNFVNQTLELAVDQVASAREIITRVDPKVKLQEREREGDQAEEKDPGERNTLLTLGITAVLLAAGFIWGDWLRQTPYSWAEYLVLLPAYLLAGWPVLLKAARNLTSGRVFDENFLMGVASLGAIAIRQLPEAVGVMLFYGVGEYLQNRAVNRSRRSIAALLDIRPDYANLNTGSTTRRVSPEEVLVGQVIFIKPGERVPLDGEVLEGVSFLDTSALTGEAVPRRAETGEGVMAGMVNGEGLLTVRVTRPFSQSSVARILELVEKAASRKAPTEQFITTFSRYYTPAVVFSALALALIPPLVIPGANLSDWVYRALVLLVISCPCALVISIPLGYFGGIGGASRRGILIKGANYLETLAALDTVVFDKTGTLTKGIFKVVEVATRNGFSREELLESAAAAEIHSSHPIAQSIRQAYGKVVGEGGVKDYREIPGHGVSALVAGRKVLAGNDRLMESEGIPYNAAGEEGTLVHVAIDGAYAGYMVIADEMKEDAPRAIANLKRLGIKNIVMLTGDEEAVASRVARNLGLDAYYAGLLPEDKVARVEELKAALPRNRKLAFVGDGINDAPVITRADVGVAMGGLGSDAAIEAADVVLMEDAPSKLATAIEVARHTKSIVRQNVVMALGFKGFFLALGAFGLAGIWEAVFADVGVALLAVLNASRTMVIKQREGEK